MFWLTFAQMCRLVRSGGYIYLSAPPNGTFHRYPTDNWRFYPDAGIALAKWGRRGGYDVRLIESLIGRRGRDIWNDCVMVFGKGETRPPVRFLADLFPRSFNIRIGQQQCFRNYCGNSEDMRLQFWMAKKLQIFSDLDSESGVSPIGGMIATPAEREVALAAAERDAAEQVPAVEARLAEEAARPRGEAEQQPAVVVHLAEEARLRAQAEQWREEVEGRLAEEERQRTDAERRLAQAGGRLAEMEGSSRPQEQQSSPTWARTRHSLSASAITSGMNATIFWGRHSGG